MDFNANIEINIREIKSAIERKEVEIVCPNCKTQTRIILGSQANYCTGCGKRFDLNIRID